MLASRRFVRSYRFMLLILLSFCVLLTQATWVIPAQAAPTSAQSEQTQTAPPSAQAAAGWQSSASGNLQSVPQIETVQAVPEGAAPRFALLYVPDFTWEGIERVLAESDAGMSAASSASSSASSSTASGATSGVASGTAAPAASQSASQATSPLLRLLERSAFGNLSAPKDWEIAELLQNSGLGIYRLAFTSSSSGSLSDSLAPAGTFPAPAVPLASTATSASLSAAAEAINTFIERGLSQGGILVITTASSFNGGAVSREFTPVIICGGSFTGYLTSDTTHRRGLITAGDISGLYNNLTSPESFPVGPMIRSVAAGDSVATRVAYLHHDSTTVDSMLATKTPANIAFLTLVFITFALSILILVLGRRKTPGSRGVLIPAIRILWLIVLAFPPATFLMFFLLPAQPTATDLIIANVAWVGVVSFGALLIGWRTTWVNSLIALFALVIAVIVAGQIFGGPLNSAGYLTYDIAEGSRYYGMGNEQGAILFGSWITLSGLLINRYPDARGIPAFKKWGYPLGSVVLLFIATSPWLGASFGPLVWGFLGCFFSWWLFNRRRLCWWFVALVLAAAFGLALGILYADVSLNPASHMSQVVPSMREGFGALIVRIAMDVWTYSLNLIHDYVPAIVVVFLVFVFILLVVLRVLQPGTYREFWQRNTAFRATYSVCFVLASITFVLEDSGVFTPAVLLIYPIACFVWLICDLHSWHLRELAASGDGAEPPVTLRELQQRALGLFSRNDEGGERTPQEEPTLPTPQDERESPTSPESLAPQAPPPTSQALQASQTLQTYVPKHARPPEEAPPPSVGRSTATMSAATLLSRVTGFVRTWAMAFALGNTALTSAYTIANNLPNTLFELFAGGVLTTAFLPIYLAQLEKRGKDGASSYASKLLSICAIILGVVAFLATIFAPQVVFTQSFLKSDGFDVQSAVFFFRFFAIQVFFYGVGAIINGLLNAHRSFLWPALGPVFNNIVVIITFFAYPFIAMVNPVVAMTWLAIGTTLGVVAIFIVQVPALIKLKIRLRFHVDLRDPALKDTLKMALPATIFIIMSVASVSVMTACALSVTPKGPATIQFAWLWYQLPYGVIAVALSTALLTEMSKASAAEDWGEFRNSVRLGLRGTIFLIIPLAAIIFAMSNQLAGLYHAGEFTYDDVLNVARVVATWCVALPFYAAYMFIYKVFSSMRDLKRFIIIDAFGRVLLMLLYGFFTSGFGLFDGFGLIGIPLADACVYALLTGAMLFVLRKRIGSFGLTGIVFDGCKVLVAALLASALPFAVSFGNYDQTILISLVTIAVCGIFALGIYYLFCRLFRVPETEMVGSIVSRVRGLLRQKKKE